MKELHLVDLSVLFFLLVNTVLILLMASFLVFKGLHFVVIFESAELRNLRIFFFFQTSFLHNILLRLRLFSF